MKKTVSVILVIIILIVGGISAKIFYDKKQVELELEKRFGTTDMAEYVSNIKQNVEEKKIEQTTRLNIIYDENNYSQLILTLKDDETSIIGVCVFDGTDLRNETLRSLAFTVYCLENANTFCEGNFIMTYKSGELTGFANYTNGECTLSDFPDVWNEYASEITQTEIEAEIQNIIDNIK